MIHKQNSKIYLTTQLLHSLIFTIPIWIIFYQSRISVSQISLIVTFQYVIQMVLELPSGAFADLFGRRATNLLGFIAGVLGFALVPFAQTFTHYLVLAFLVGLSDSFRSGSEEALLYDSFKQDKCEDKYEKVYADGNMLYQVGLITATFLGGFLFEVSESLPYFLYALSLAIGAIATFSYIEPNIDSERFTLSNYRKQIIQGSKEAFKNSYTTSLSLFYIIVGGIAWSSTLYFNGYMMIELGFSDSLRGVLTAIMRLINVVVIAKLLTNKKLFNTQRTFIFFPVIMLAGYLPGFLLDGYLGLPFVQAAMIVTTARWIVLSPLTNKVFSSKYRATAISFLSLMIGFIYIAMTSLSGFIIPTYGIKVMYSLLGVISALLVIPLTIKLVKSSKEQEATV